MRSTNRILFSTIKRAISLSVALFIFCLLPYSISAKELTPVKISQKTVQKPDTVLQERFFEKLPENFSADVPVYDADSSSNDQKPVLRKRGVKTVYEEFRENVAEVMIHECAGSFARGTLTTDAERSVYDTVAQALYDYLKSGRDVDPGDRNSAFAVDYGSFGLDDEQFVSVMNAFDLDYCHLYWWSGVAYGNGEGYMRIHPEYGNVAVRDALDTMILNELDRYEAIAASGENNYEKAFLVHNELAREVVYANNASGDPEDALWAHTVTGAFDRSHMAVVCEGYAKSYCMILEYMDIPCIYVAGHPSGSGDGHGWNAVSFDGGDTYVDIDVTWDDTDTSDEFYLRYFAPSHAFFEESHGVYNMRNALCSKINYNANTGIRNSFYGKCGFYADSRCTDYQAFARSAKEKAEALSLRVLQIYSENDTVFTNVTNAMYALGYYTDSYSYNTADFDGNTYKCLFLNLSYIRVANPCTAFSFANAALTRQISDGAVEITISGFAPAASDDRIYLTSSDEDVALVMDPYVALPSDNSFTIWPKYVGTSTIKARTASGNVVRTFVLTVEDENAAAATSVKLSKDFMHLVPGKENQLLQASVLPAGAVQKVRWTSSNASIASVDKYGIVTPVSAGTCYIIAASYTDPSVTASCKVTVLNPGEGYSKFYVQLNRDEELWIDKDGINYLDNEYPKIRFRDTTTGEEYASGEYIKVGTYHIYYNDEDTGSSFTIENNPNSGKIRTLSCYTVTYFDVKDGTRLGRESVYSRFAPKAANITVPDRTMHGELYTFFGWDKVLSRISSKTDCYAIYRPKKDETDYLATTQRNGNTAVLWNIDADGHLTVWGEAGDETCSWRGNSTKDLITTATFSLQKPASLRYICRGLTKLRSVSFVDCDTEGITMLSQAFYGCANLETLDLSMLDLSSVTSCISVFTDCGSLSQLTLPAGVPVTVTLPSVTNSYWVDESGATVTATTANLTTKQTYTRRKKVTGVSLSPASYTLKPGKTLALTAEVIPADAYDKSVSFQSNKPSVATVDTNGVVTAVSNGTATITVTTADGGKKATCSVTVDDRCQVTVLVKKDGQSWEGENAPVITLKKTGASAQANGSLVPPGNYDLYADGKALDGETVTVTNEDITKDLNYYTISFMDDDRQTLLQEDILLAGAYPVFRRSAEDLWHYADGYTYTFTGFSPQIVKAAARAVYYAEYEKTAVDPAESITLDKTRVYLTQGGEIKLQAELEPDTALQKLVWTSTDTDVATVASDGTVTAKGGGTCQIKAASYTDPDVSASCLVTVFSDMDEYSRRDYAIYKDDVLWADYSGQNQLDDEPPVFTWKNAETDEIFQSGDYIRAGSYHVLCDGEDTGLTAAVTGDQGKLSHFIYRFYTIRFLDGKDGDQIASELVLAGMTPEGNVTPQAYEKDGVRYVFHCWDKDIATVRAQKTYYALYRPDVDETDYLAQTQRSGSNSDILWNIDPDGHLTAWGMDDPDQTYRWRANDSKELITSATFRLSGPTSLMFLCNGLKNLTSVSFEGCDTSAVTTVGSAFNGCSLLETLDLSMLDLSGVTGNSGMFSGCTALSGLTLPANCPSIIDLPPVTSAYYWADEEGNEVTGVLSGLSSKMTYRKLKKVTGISISESSLSLVIGQKESLTSSVTPSDAYDQAISWSSSAPSVATVEDGVVKAVGAGEAVITVSSHYGGYEKTCKVTVAKKTPKVYLVLSADTIYHDEPLPALTLGEGSSEGSISFDAGQPLVIGTNSYTWTFTPEDPDENTATGSLTVTVIKRPLTPEQIEELIEGVESVIGNTEITVTTADDGTCNIGDTAGDADVKAFLAEKINAMLEAAGYENTVDADAINITSRQNTAEGTAENPQGTNGVIKYTVTLQIDENSYTLSERELVIPAKAYQSTDPGGQGQGTEPGEEPGGQGQETVPTNPDGDGGNAVVDPAKPGGNTSEDTTAPGKVTLKSAKNKKTKSVTLQWKATEGAEGYVIEYATSKKFAKKKIKKSSKTLLTVKRLKKGKTYYFRIRAYKVTDDGETLYGAYSKVKKVKIKK